MTHQSIRTALALYQGGTIDAETAARKAGVTPAQLERSARHLSVPTPETTSRREAERVQVGAD